MPVTVRETLRRCTEMECNGEGVGVRGDGRGLEGAEGRLIASSEVEHSMVEVEGLSWAHEYSALANILAKGLFTSYCSVFHLGRAVPRRAARVHANTSPRLRFTERSW